MPESLNITDTLSDTVAAYQGGLNEAAEAAKSSGALDLSSNYMVMAVTLIIWVGIFVYLMALDKKTRKLEVKK